MGLEKESCTDLCSVITTLCHGERCVNLPCLSAALIKNAQTPEGVTVMCVCRDKMLIFVRYWKCR